MNILSPIRQGEEAERLRPWGQEPERLWSLWDMLEFNAASFLEVIVDVRNIQKAILDERTKKGRTFRRRGTVGGAFKDYIREVVDKLALHLRILDVRGSVVLVDRILDDPDLETPLTWDRLSKRFEHLIPRLHDELTLKKILTVEGADQDFYEPHKPLFGDAFALGFVSAAFDLDEAAKCMALGRPMAGVFHLMRVMECGLKAIAKCLGCPDPVRAADRNWAFMIRHVKDALAAKWPSQADKLTPDYELFESLCASLDAIKGPWRNATMHVENKYTDDEARHIFYAVKGFMKKLASRCDEAGEQKA